MTVPIALELNARAREASDLAQALAEQGCLREQAELALAREKSVHVQLANDLEGRTAELAQAQMDNRVTVEPSAEFGPRGPSQNPSRGLVNFQRTLRLWMRNHTFRRSS